VRTAFPVDDRTESLQKVNLVELDNARFVITIPYQKDVLGVGSEPFHRGVYDRIKVVRSVMFGAYITLVSATIGTTLHNAVEVSVDDDSSISAYRFIQMILEEFSVAMRIIPMQVGDEQELGLGFAVNDVDILGDSFCSHCF
jgi:hypothetical protein